MQKEKIMKKDDLTQVKHIGAARMKLLNDLGINTTRQLYEMPLEKLARIETVGEHYAKLIKEAVSESYGESPEKTASKTASGKEKDAKEINQNLRKQIKVLKKQLKQASENLKPLGKKKYLGLYIDFKKRSKTLKTRLSGLDQIRGDLSKEVTENIIKNADGLNTTLKNLGGKPKKKIYKKVAQEIQLFSKILKKAGS
jgi:nucleotidyltransferase/DNA polymerase involved in DNA repair